MHTSLWISGEETNRVGNRPGPLNSGPYGSTHIMKSYACRYFWWPEMATDIKLFCESCSTCQTTKMSNQWPQGLLHSLLIPTQPWASISMDFVGPFPLTDNFDYIWVVLCRLTSLVHLIPLWTTMTASQLMPLFMTHVVCLHRLPETIVSDHDPKFMSAFWTEMYRLLGIKLAKSTVFHPQTNGASERMIHKVLQILRTLVRPDQLDWLAMTEFTINLSVSASTGFAPFESTYGYLPRVLQSVGKSTFSRVQDSADDAHDMVMRAHDAIITSHVEQTHQANQWQWGDDPLMEVGQKAYLSTENLNLPKAQAWKLMPKVHWALWDNLLQKRKFTLHTCPTRRVTQTKNTPYIPCQTAQTSSPEWQQMLPQPGSHILLWLWQWPLWERGCGSLVIGWHTSHSRYECRVEIGCWLSYLNTGDTVSVVHSGHKKGSIHTRRIRVWSCNGA